ncbi:MAG: hypothetical protein NTW65_12855 [Deltaproteobacteria bacterium]|nr:hypothetical protein [Deltaproteobacteria bacterium]
MLRRDIKTKILILLVSVILSFQIISNSYAGIFSGRTIKYTAKITFFKNKAGELMAEIIPTTPDGYYPRSGWTVCEVIASDIKKIYSEKVKDVKRIEGYFVVTYKIIEKDKHSIILMYKGELLKIEPWNPPFIKN